MVGIEVDKYCCGNCGDWNFGLCWGDVIYCGLREPTKPACGRIHDNYIDREYKADLRLMLEKDFFPPKDTRIRSKDADNT